MAILLLLISDLSTSIKDLKYDLNPEGGRRFFDTHAVVRLFEENGLFPLLLKKKKNKKKNPNHYAL